MVEIRRLGEVLSSQQGCDGAWRFCFESGPMTDAYMIILQHTLGMGASDLVTQLARRIASLQSTNGSWQLYADEANEGNLSATIEAYYALLAAEFYPAGDEHLYLAKKFILAKGGLQKASITTRVILALTGQIPWKRYSLPPEWMLLPAQLPLSFFDFVGYARVHIAPVLFSAGKQAQFQAHALPDITHLLAHPARDNLQQNSAHTRPHPGLAWKHGVPSALTYFPAKVRKHALHRTEQFILARIESDGTLYSYASATFLMVLGFLSRGYPHDHPIIRNAVQGLKSLVYNNGTHAHLQNSTSTVWDTALLSYAMQAAGTPASNRVIQSSTHYLLSRQHQRLGDWRLHNRHGQIGGWGFSDINTMNPDVDDTAAALRAIWRTSKVSPLAHSAWTRGLGWLLSMQNADGGWSSFDKNRDQGILSAIDIDGAQTVLTDPSTPDLTGRTLEFLGNYAGYSTQHRSVARGVTWLLRHQRADGSWRGRWGICYLYGTWAALTGLLAVGVSATHPSILRAVQWLLNTQNLDGGWGESCTSEVHQTFVPVHSSTLSQTAWVVDALTTVFDTPIPAVQRGIAFLLENGRTVGFAATYPTGAGLPGGFNIHYHSYRYVWPLLALGHYHQKYA